MCVQKHKHLQTNTQTERVIHTLVSRVEVIPGVGLVAVVFGGIVAGVFGEHGNVIIISA